MMFPRGVDNKNHEEPETFFRVTNGRVNIGDGNNYVPSPILRRKRRSSVSLIRRFSQKTKYDGIAFDSKTDSSGPGTSVKVSGRQSYQFVRNDSSNLPLRSRFYSLISVDQVKLIMAEAKKSGISNGHVPRTTENSDDVEESQLREEEDENIVVASRPAVGAPLAALDDESDSGEAATMEDNSSDGTDAPSITADPDDVINNIVAGDDDTEPPEESSDEGTLGANSLKDSLESLKDDDGQSVASTTVPICISPQNPTLSVSSSSAASSQPNNNNLLANGALSPLRVKTDSRSTDEDADISFVSAADDSLSYSSGGTNELSGPESDKGQATDQYFTAGEERVGGYTSAASRRTVAFFSANESEFHSAVSSGGEEDSDNDSNNVEDSNRTPKVTKKQRMNSILQSKIAGQKRALVLHKGQKSVSINADGDYLSCDDSSSVYTSPLPVIRRVEDSEKYLARPSSTISTSSAEYHTPSYVSSGEERGLAGGDDSEFSEMDDFTFAPNMAASIWSQNCMTPALASSEVKETKVTTAEAHNLPSNTSFNFHQKKPIKIAFRASDNKKQQPVMMYSKGKSKHVLTTDTSSSSDKAFQLKPHLSSSVSSDSSNRSKQTHSEAIEEATKWLSETNRFINNSDCRNATAHIMSPCTATSTTVIEVHKQSGADLLPSNDPFVSSFDANSIIQSPSNPPSQVSSNAHNPFDNPFNPFANMPSNLDPSPADALDSSASPLILEELKSSAHFFAASEVSPNGPNTQGIQTIENSSDHLLMINDPNDPLLLSDPLVDSAAPLLFTKGPMGSQSEHGVSAQKSTNPFVIQTDKVAEDTVNPPNISEAPQCSNSFQQDWVFMLRFPPEKQIGKNRRWMSVDVKFDAENSILKIYDKSKGTETSWNEILVSNRLYIDSVRRQKYDDKGKIHTLKLVETIYRRRNQFDKIVATAMQQPLESRYIPEKRIRAKLGTVDHSVMDTFVKLFDDYQFQNKTVKNLQQGSYWSHPEIHIEVSDDCKGSINNKGDITDENISTSIYTLSFFVKSPEVKIGINDERVKGAEVVRRSDILPMKSDSWIKFSDVQFHHTVDKALYIDDRTIVFQPIDACKYKLAQFQVKQHFYKETPIKPLVQFEQSSGNVKIEAEFFLPSIQKIDFNFEAEMRRCENIQLVIPVPEQWVSILRYARPLLGEGSVKAAKKKTGYISKTKVHGVRIQVTAGVAKYEHAYKAIVWRINRLPGKSSVSICSYKMFVQLISPNGVLQPFEEATLAHLSYSMAWTVASGAVIRSMAITNLPVEPLKRVEYKANFSYDVAILDCRKHESNA